MSPQVLGIALAAALVYFVGVGIVDGAKWVGHEAKKGGTAIVHVLKKISHGHRQN